MTLSLRLTAVQHVDNGSPGYRVFLPASVLDTLSRGGDLNYPLTFSLRSSVRGSGASSFTVAGVSEFTAKEGTVELPSAVADMLGVAFDGLSDVEISVDHVDLPRATSVTLQSLSHGFHTSVDDHRAALEHAIREGGYVALHVGMVVNATAEGRDFPLAVTATSPASSRAVVVIDTDCEVILEGSEVSADVAATVVTTGPVRSKQLQLGEPLQATTAGNDYVYFSVKVPPAQEGTDLAQQQVLRFTAAPAAGAPTVELDLYAAFAPVSKPSLGVHDFAADAALETAGAPRVLEVPVPTGHSGSLHVGCRATNTDGSAVSAGDPVAFTITADVTYKPAPASPASAAASAEATATEAPAGTSKCDNCGAFVPSGSLALHTATCARNNVRCPFPDCGALLRRGPAAAAEHAHCSDCGVVMAARQLPKHGVLYHSPLPCGNGCGCAPLKQEALARHMRHECAQRSIVCRYCGVTTQAGDPPRDYGDRLKGLSSHESYCGSRTAPCGGCKQPTQLKLYDTHWAVAHPGQAVLPPSLELPLRPAADRAPAPVRAPAAPAAAASDGWACQACSFRNPSSGSSGSNICGMCGTVGPAVSAAGAAALGRNSPLAPVPCRNQTCGASASKAGDACRLQLCSSCFRSFGHDLPHAEEEGDVTMQGTGADDALFQRYGRQLSSGCGRPGACTNVHCAASSSAASGGSPFADQSAHLAWLLQEASSAPPRYYVCSDAATSRPARWPQAGGAPRSGASSLAGTPAASPTLAASSQASAPSALALGSSAAATLGLPRPVSAGLSAAGIVAAAKKKTTGSRVAGAFF